jgi:hypothetical protein
LSGVGRGKLREGWQEGWWEGWREGWSKGCDGMLALEWDVRREVAQRICGQ